MRELKNIPVADDTESDSFPGKAICFGARDISRHRLTLPDSAQMIVYQSPAFALPNGPMDLTEAYKSRSWLY